MDTKSDDEVSKHDSQIKLNRRLCELVLDALEKLEDQNGSSHKAIKNYIALEHDLDSDVLSRHLSTALKRGVEFGVLTRSGGKYRLNDSLENITTHRCQRRRTCRKKRRSCRRRRRSCRRRSRCKRRRRRKC